MSLYYFNTLLKVLVLNLAHTIPKTKVYWYVSEKYIVETKMIHEQSVAVLAGTHVFKVLDELGNERKLSIEILE